MTRPGKDHGASPGFAEHASVEAIDHQLRRAYAARDRWERHIRKLTELRAVREAAAAGAAAADEALAAALEGADVTVARVRRPDYARAVEGAYEAHQAAVEPRPLPKCCRDHGVPARVAVCGWDCHEAHTYVLPCELANEALREAATAEHREEPSLVWRYDDHGRMIHDSCGAEIYQFKEGPICAACEAQEPAAQHREETP